jgi:amino acid transporter
MTHTVNQSQRQPKVEDKKLGLQDVTGSTVANIGPGIDFYFAFGVIAVTAGIAAPLTIIAAGIAVFFLAFVVAEFTKMEPSAGSFITYVETSLGPKAGVVTALLITVGFTVAITGVFTMAGGMISLTFEHYASWHPSWLPIALLVTIGAIWLTLRGASLSTAAVGIAMAIQVLCMVAVCAIVLIDQSSHLSSTPFSWSHLNNGLAGLSAGFPLALYMLIGWENGPRLPRRFVTRAAPSRELSTPHSRSQPASSSSSPIPPSPVSTTTPLPSVARRCRSSKWPIITSAAPRSWPGWSASRRCSARSSQL